MCNRKQALDAFFSTLFNETFHAIIGGVCSADTKALAAVTQYYNLTLVRKAYLLEFQG